MENDILLEGIIQYTKKNKLKWHLFNENKLNLIYRSSLPISNIKRIQLEFKMSKENDFKSSMSVDILINKNRLRTYKFITLFDLRKNRFEELFNLIEKQNI